LWDLPTALKEEMQFFGISEVQEAINLALLPVQRRAAKL